MRQTPRATTLEEILLACERHIRNKYLEIADCNDCDDAQPGEIETMKQTAKNWQDLADDVTAILKKKA